MEWFCTHCSRWTYGLWCCWLCAAPREDSSMKCQICGEREQKETLCDNGVSAGTIKVCGDCASMVRARRKAKAQDKVAANVPSK